MNADKRGLYKIRVYLRSSASAFFGVEKLFMAPLPRAILDAVFAALAASVGAKHPKRRASIRLFSKVCAWWL